jgi:hypothetical protein
MKIYTFFQNLNFKQQYKLIEIWKKSWEANGFEPVVLFIEDAKRSTYYKEFLEKISSLTLKITGRELNQYGLSCYLRWLAYSAVADSDYFLVSDYDIINKNFKPAQIIEETNKLSFMDGLCPCIAYGKKEQFSNFSEDIIYLSSLNIESIKYDFIKRNLKYFHDQNFLVLNEPELRKSSIYNICPARKYVYPYIHMDPKICSAELIHVSRHSVNESTRKFHQFKKIDTDELRILLANRLLEENV